MHTHVIVVKIKDQIMKEVQVHKGFYSWDVAPWTSISGLEGYNRQKKKEIGDKALGLRFYVEMSFCTMSAKKASNQD